MTRNGFLTVTVLALALVVVMLGAVAVSAGPAPGTISGNVYCDANDNGVFDSGEGVSGVEVYLHTDPDCDLNPYNDGSYIGSQNSGLDGAYSFTGLIVDAGCHWIEVGTWDQDLGFCRVPTGPTDQSVQLTGSEPDAEGVDFGFVSLWTKLVNGEPWAPDMTVTAETSDTIEIVDVVFVPRFGLDSDIVRQQEPESMLVETWNPAALALIDVDWTEFTTVTYVSGVLTWTIPMFKLEVPTATVTKTFHVEPCTWTSTTVEEILYVQEVDNTLPLDAVDSFQFEQRNIIVNKTPPNLSIDSTYDAEVSPGDQASFTLHYSNTGGYENDVMIRNEFPAGGLFVSANPAPTGEAADDTWAEWDVGDLATGAGGSIVVNVSIGADLPPSTTIPITDHIYNHVREVADTVVSVFHIEQPPLSLGDLVWYDTDQDGIQDAGEPGVKGISATLHLTPDCSGNDPLATDETDANGIYGFSNLFPGTYCIQFDNIPAGWEISPQKQGSDGTVDSDADPTTARIENIQLRVTDLDEDMGLYVVGSNGGRVFCDANKNSQYDTGEEVAGVTVSLHDDPGCDGAPINLMETQDTPADGTYLFSDLDVGPRGEPLCTYASVDEDDMGACNVPITPVGYAVALDADNPNESGHDFGFQEPPPEPSSLGDRVWHDADQDGIQDQGEVGLGGVGLTLYDCEGSLLRTTTTDASGAYGFTGLEVGSYVIGFSLPQGWQFTLQNEGCDEPADSDADPTTGRTVCIALGAGVDDPTWDAGMFLIPVIEPEAPPVVPEASTLLLLGSALTGLAGYAGLQMRARRRK